MKLQRFVPTLLGLLLPAGLLAAATTVGTFTGGDPGEGLDLEGNFLYAVNVGPSGAAGQVGDAFFTGVNVSGVTMDARAEIGAWGGADYGTTQSDRNLSKVMRSIYHMWPPPLPPMHLRVTGLEPGAAYKLQLLFTEACCTRGFDIWVNGALEVDELDLLGTQGGLANQATTGVVATHEFTAPSGTLEVVLDGNTITTPELTDHNPTLAGFTLERTSAVTDSDHDGLTDDWELKYFGNLSYGGSDDPDGDSLDNAAEFAARSDPTKKDTDGDGLSDADELNVHHTSPIRADTDGDGLSDQAELTRYHTDPLQADTDGDGYNDYDEVHMMTDPNNKASFPSKTTFTVFTGGDAGEGLDLDGSFLYAINVGPPDAVGPIRDAYFTEDTVEGVTISGGFIAGNWHPNLNFGDTVNDDVLELMMSTIRWSDAGDPVTPTLNLSLANLEVGAAYRLQLLFAEEGWMRGFDITVDGRFIVDDFAPFHYQGGFTKTNGVVLTHNFIASASTVTIVLDGRTVTTAEFVDHNPILQGATLKLTAPNVDSDHDGLPDPWEADMLGGLSYGPADDPDRDGLDNAAEFAAGTDPRNADTDADGLSDSVELLTYHTNPLKTDSDQDGLSDADEVNRYHSDPTKADTDGDGLSDADEVLVVHTDPAKADSDGDGFSDYDELRLLSDPKDKTSFPRNPLIGVFTGGDPGEGLDLDGDFLYAIQVGSPFAAGPIRDADFTLESVEGVTVSSGNVAPNWYGGVFGDTEADAALQVVMASIRWSDAASLTPTLRLNLDLLEPGTRYKLQLLFAEACCFRGFDIFIDGRQVADDFSPRHYQGADLASKGVVLTYEFDAANTNITVLMDGRGTTSPGLTDHNPILQAATLEVLGSPPAPPKITAVELRSGTFSVTFDSVAGRTYALQFRADLGTGLWQDVPNDTTATSAQTTLRDAAPGHTGLAQGYWRVVER
jgi:hypothetical protein